MPKHEFGIIDCFIENQWYSVYLPEVYGCIKIDDDLIEPLLNKFLSFETFYQVTTQPGHGLDYGGITIIPPRSLPEFLDIIVKANNENKSDEYEKLIEKITEAIEADKYMIHYGL
jgi:hypothetical protein